MLNCVSTGLSETSRTSWRALNAPFAVPFRGGLLGSSSWTTLWGMRQRPDSSFSPSNSPDSSICKIRRLLLRSILPASAVV